MLSLIFIGVLITCSSFFLEFRVLMLIILLTLKVIFIKLVNVENVIIEYIFIIDLIRSIIILLTIWITFLIILSRFAKEVQKNKIFLFYVTFIILLLIICFTVINLLAFYFFLNQFCFLLLY